MADLSSVEIAHASWNNSSRTPTEMASELGLQTAAEGLTMEEGKQINRSLSALSNVVQALTAGAPD